MHLYKIILFFSLVFLSLLNVSYPQSDRLLKTALSPSESSFSYPQSLFVDSKSGQIWVADFSNNRVLRFDVSTLSSVDKTNAPVIAGNMMLAQNYPNPFNPLTQIYFSVKQNMHTTLKVYNALGQEVSVLFNKMASADEIYTVSFDATGLQSGIYIYVLSTSLGREVKKMCLLK